MKKTVAIALAAITMFTFAACGKFKCDLCQQEKSGKKHTTEIMGNKITICDDCYSMGQ